VRGYEIRHGHTEATAPVAEALPGGRGWVRGPVLGVSVHGLLEHPALLAALFGRAPERSLDAALDELADSVMAGLNRRRIDALAGVA
jgi:adenosylcobyric acid synthase